MFSGLAGGIGFAATYLRRLAIPILAFCLGILPAAHASAWVCTQDMTPVELSLENPGWQGKPNAPKPGNDKVLPLGPQFNVPFQVINGNGGNDFLSTVAANDNRPVTLLRRAA